MPGPSGIPLVDVYRGEFVESVHAVAACAVDVEGRTLIERGDVEVPVYLRSTAKPFIAAAIVATGAAERFGFDARELAVMAASHNGEPFHVEAVRGILRKIGLDERALQCGAHAPSYEPAAAALAATGASPSAVHNNCSGKHAGILAGAVHLGADPATYRDPENPVQRHIAAFCGRAFADDPARWPTGIDGCGAPIFASSLRRTAGAFARLATLEGLDGDDARALGAVRAAMLAEPAYVGGTARFDTALMRITYGGIACKGGAEGLHGDALVRARAGFALKVVDGNSRATPPATLAFLRALRALEPGEVDGLAGFAEPEVRNVAGRVVGKISARAL
jgi:L-asparaginase II